MQHDGPNPAPTQTPATGATEALFVRPAMRRPRWWLHYLLLVLTFITTSVMGAGFADSFNRGVPVDVIAALEGYLNLGSHPGLLLQGLPFSIPLIGILLAHEMGHYLTCRKYGVDATPPFFLPFPAPIGTLGAFIRIRAPIYSRKALFDIAANGPLAGFALLVPVLAAGIAASKVIPGSAEQGDLVFGVPLIVRLLEDLFFPGVPSADIYLHPVARAAWVGVLATALNLLPIGQLDGGHILYAFVRERSRLISRILIAVLVPLAWFWPSWLVWALFLFFFALRHPAIYDPQPPGARRSVLAICTAAILVLCFTVQPIRR